MEKFHLSSKRFHQLYLTTREFRTLLLLWLLVDLPRIVQVVGTSSDAMGLLVVMCKWPLHLGEMSQTPPLLNDGLSSLASFNPLSIHLFSLVKTCTSLSSGHALVLFFLPIVQVWAFLTTLTGLHMLCYFVSWCFVLWVDKLLSQGVGALEMHWDVLFI